MRWFWFFLLSTQLFAIDLNLPVSATQNAANGLALPAQNPSVSAIHPALSYAGLETGVTYLYSIEDLPYYLIHLNYRWKNLGFYLGNERLDHPLYSENQTHFALNYHFEFLHFGLQTRYLHSEVSNYHTCSTFLYDAGTSWESESFLTSFTLRNILQTNLYDDPLPVFYVWEVQYNLLENASLFAGIEKQESYDFLFRIASVYEIFPFFSMICSYQYEPQRLGVGAEIAFQKWEIAYSIRTHQYLSLSHFLSLCYDFSP